MHKQDTRPRQHGLSLADLYDPLLMIKLKYVISLHKHSASIVSILGGEIKRINQTDTSTSHLLLYIMQMNIKNNKDKLY